MSKRIFTPEQEVFIKDCYDNGLASVRKLASMFSVSDTTIRFTVKPELRQKHTEYENKKRAAKRKKAEPVKAEEVKDNIRTLTLAEVSKKVQDGTKRIHGEIQNATIEDLQTLSDTFNVSFTVYFE